MIEEAWKNQWDYDRFLAFRACRWADFRSRFSSISRSHSLTGAFHGSLLLGMFLIRLGGAIVPFSNELPKNTELYRLMSTKPGED